MSTQKRVPDVFAAKRLCLLPGDVQACWLRVEAKHLLYKAPSTPGDSQKQDTSTGGILWLRPCFPQHRYVGANLFTQGRL